VGGRLLERLSEIGVPVRAAARMMSRAKPMPGVQWVLCDIAQEDDLRRALAGIETVYHCGAMAGAPGSLEDYVRVNVDATVRLLELAEKAGVEKVIYLSSIGVYAMPRSSQQFVEEDSPFDSKAAERGCYTQGKVRAEETLKVYVCEHREPRLTILRPGTIYGPGSELPIGRLPLFRSHRGGLVAGGRGVPMPLVHVDNVIDAMLAAAAANVPSGRAFDIVDSPDLDQGEVARLLREVSGGRIRLLFVPYLLVWTLMLGLDLIGLVRRGRMGTMRYRLKRTLADMRYRCTAAHQELGWKARIPQADGLAGMVGQARDI
jgi:nucleoside-diphosphate-sugar epimerase